ncbi:MAG: protein kinase [Myxococcales bacterium]|nr:protein kinase [Myxococcales bacterium]
MTTQTVAVGARFAIQFVDEGRGMATPKHDRDAEPTSHGSGTATSTPNQTMIGGSRVQAPAGPRPVALPMGTPAHAMPQVAGAEAGFAATLAPGALQVDASGVPRAMARMESSPMLAPQEAPTPGTLLGQFELVKELGRGGMGVVYLARDLRLGRLVAIKLMTNASQTMARRLLEEAQTTAQCQHENIVIVYSADEWRGVPYLALEFLEGQSVAERLLQGPLSPRETIELLSSVARALVKAHSMGIVHCDLKPENVFCVANGQVKVLDFGISRVVAVKRNAAIQAAALNVLKVTQDDTVSGTIEYMAPEQWGVDEIDHRSDIWAVGIMAWIMLTGKHPLGEEVSLAAAVASATNLDVPLPSIATVMPALPPRLIEAIDCCLHKHKSQRFADAQALLAVLESLSPRRMSAVIDAEASPYPGIGTFQEEDSARFFGRDREIAHAVARLQETPMLVITAPSGVGKSSFLRAGVMPALKALGPWEAFIVRPGRAPIESLAAAIEPLCFARDQGGGAQLRARIATRLRQEPGFLGNLLRSRARKAGVRVALMVDQLEEVVTQCDSPAERSVFLQALAGVADDRSSPLRLLTSIRSDFIDRLSDDAPFFARVRDGLFLLPPMKPDNLREAIVRPLELTAYRLESPTMVEDMVASLAGTPGALPLLQFAAASLWEVRDTARRLLTEAAYQEMGGALGALGSHADRTLSLLSPPRQQLAKRVLQLLVSGEGTRVATTYDELVARFEANDELGAVIEHLVAGRLLVIQKGEATYVELAHEYLAQGWPTLRKWREESREDSAYLRQLASAAKQWHARDRSLGLLWTGDDAVAAQRFAARYAGELTGVEREYLQAVTAQHARTQRARRLRRLGLAAAASVVIAGLAVGLVVVKQAQGAAQAEASRAVAAESQSAARLAALEKEKADREAAEREKRAADAQLAAAQGLLSQAQLDLAAAEKTLLDSKAALSSTIAQLATGDTKSLAALSTTLGQQADAAFAQAAAATKQIAEVRRQSEDARQEAVEKTKEAAQARQDAATLKAEAEAAMALARKESERATLALAALERAERVAKEAGAVATQERKLRETEAEKARRLEQEKLTMEQELAAKQRAREQQAGSLIKDL